MPKYHLATANNIQSRIFQFVLILIALLFSITLLAPLSSHAAKKPKASKDHGYLLLYSQGGKYKKAVIILGANAPKDAKCGTKKFFNSKGTYKNVTVSLSSGKKNKSGQVIATKLKCTPGNYNVYFLKKGEKTTKNTFGVIYDDTTPFTAVGLSNGYCSFVHRTGVTRNEKIVNDRCVGDADPNADAIEKVTPIMTATANPNPIIRGKKSTYTLELKHPAGEPLSPEECAGSTTYTGRLVKRYEFSLRYNPKTKTCMYKTMSSSSNTKEMLHGEHQDVLRFQGNKFLNPTGEITHHYKVVDNPNAKKLPKTSTSKTTKTKKAGAISVSSAKVKRDKSRYVMTSTYTIKNAAASCDVNTLNPSVTAYLYSKKSDKPSAMPSSKAPSATAAPTAVAKGKNCIVTFAHTYPSSAKDIYIKHQVSLTADGKTMTKKSNKVKVGK